jgi:hypothetical protein
MKNNTSGTPESVCVILFIYWFRSYNDLHQDNTNIYLILPMKHGAIFFLKINMKYNMKMGGVKTHFYFEGLLSPFCLKNLINKKQLL